MEVCLKCMQHAQALFLWCQVTNIRAVDRNRFHNTVPLPLLSFFLYLPLTTAKNLLVTTSAAAATTNMSQHHDTSVEATTDTEDHHEVEHQHHQNEANDGDADNVAIMNESITVQNSNNNTNASDHHQLHHQQHHSISSTITDTTNQNVGINTIPLRSALPVRRMPQRIRLERPRRHRS